MGTTKRVYWLTDNEHFTYRDVLEDYQLRVGETFISPESGLYQPFKFENGKIIGSTFEEAQAYYGVKYEPDALSPVEVLEKRVNTLEKNIALLTTTTTDLQKTIIELNKQVLENESNKTKNTEQENKNEK